MAFEGTYNISAQSPMGEQKGVLIVKTEGNRLVGTMNDEELYDTTVDGDNFVYKVNLKGPMGKMKMTFEGTVNGDTISGTSKTMFGKVPFKGVKA